MRNSLRFVLTMVIPAIVLSASSCNSETVESPQSPPSPTKATVTFDTPLIQPVEEGAVHFITPPGWNPVDNPSPSISESEKSND